MKSKLVPIVLVAAAVAGGAWWKFGTTPASGGPLSVNGNVDIRQVDLSFQVEGRIDKLAVQEGDKVEAGQVLATLEQGYFTDYLELARARVAERQATLEKLEAGSRPQEIARAKAELAEAEAAFANAGRVFDRQKELVKTSAASRQAFDDARSALEQTRSRKEAAEQSLDLAVAGPRREDIEAARAALKGEKATMQLAERRLGDTTLKSPSAGTVLTRIKEPGAVVSAGTPVLALAMIEPVWVRAYVSGADLSRIHPGQKAKVFTDGRPDKPYDGQVGFISPTAEFTPKTVETKDLRTSLVYRFRLVIAKPDDGLRQGMPVTVVLDESDGPAR